MIEPVDPRGDSRALPPGASNGALAQSVAGPLATTDLLNRVYAEVLQPEEAHFWDYWRILVRHRWTVVSFFLVTVMVAMVWTFTTRPVFMATTTLRIEKEEPRVLKFEEVVKEANPQQDYYQTQFKILQSRTLANRVVGLLSLNQHPEFEDDDGGWFQGAQAWARERLVQWIPVPPPPAPQGAEDLVLESPLTRAFDKRLSVDPVRNARLVKVSFESHYPDLSARVANTLAEAFMAQSLGQRVEASRYATQFLAQQMEEGRQKLEASEGRLNEFLKTNDIMFVTSERWGSGRISALSS